LPASYRVKGPPSGSFVPPSAVKVEVDMLPELSKTTTALGHFGAEARATGAAASTSAHNGPSDRSRLTDWQSTARPVPVGEGPHELWANA
jgi:hypothetical protein